MLRCKNDNLYHILSKTVIKADGKQLLGKRPQGGRQNKSKIAKNKKSKNMGSKKGKGQQKKTGKTISDGRRQCPLEKLSKCIDKIETLKDKLEDDELNQKLRKRMEEKLEQLGNQKEYVAFGI